MYGALLDVKTLQTLPLGTWKAGGTVLSNAGRAVAEEMGIEALAQISIAPEVYSFKKELGLKTSVATEAYNAAMAIGTAGLVRGTGSAIFDLSSKGIKALKAKDPSLADDYISLEKTQPTQDMKTHIDNMQKVEFSGEEIAEIKAPNEKGVELNEAKVVSEIDEDWIATPEKMGEYVDDEIRAIIKESNEALKRLDDELEYEFIGEKRPTILSGFDIETKKVKPKLDEVALKVDEDMQIVVSKDIDGTPEMKSYKEINTELDNNDKIYKQISDCLLGVK